MQNKGQVTSSSQSDTNKCRGKNKGLGRCCIVRGFTFPTAKREETWVATLVECIFHIWKYEDFGESDIVIVILLLVSRRVEGRSDWFLLTDCTLSTQQSSANSIRTGEV